MAIISRFMIWLKLSITELCRFPSQYSCAFFARIIALCIMWYSASAANNIIQKRVLTFFPFPATVTMSHLLAITLLSVPALRWLGVPEVEGEHRQHSNSVHSDDLLPLPSSTSKKSSGICGLPRIISRYHFTHLILPLAIGRFIQSVAAQISIWKVPLSYAHTVKGTLPIFVVILSKFILHESQTFQVYLSLGLIVGGVVVASLTELAFDIIGLIAALSATAILALLNVFSKKALVETRIHHLWLLYSLCRLGAILYFPVWILTDFRAIFSIAWSGTPLQSAGSDAEDGSEGARTQTSLAWVAALLAVDGVLDYLQSLFAFTLLALVSPLSYSVANSSKRVAVIVASLLVLQNPVTPVNLCGIALTAVGVLLYNKAKHNQHKGSKSFSAKRATKSTFDLASGDDGRPNGALVQNGGSRLMAGGGAGDGNSVSLYIHHAREDSASALQKRVSASPAHSPRAGASSASSKLRPYQHPVLEI